VRTLIDSERRELIVRLMHEYTRALDRLDLEGWVALFAQEARYFVIPRENHARGLPIGIIYDDSRARIEDRLTYIRKIWAGHHDEFQPRHLISSVLLDKVGADEYTATSSFALYTTEPEGNTQLLAVGEYEDIVVFEDEQPRFRERKCILDTNVLPTYFVYPV
jgi:anthranilate 1,2-dioxygenase small subunit